MNAPLQIVDMAALSPWLILLTGGLLQLLLESFAEKQAKKWSLWLCLATLVCAVYAVEVAPVSEHPLLTAWLHFDAVGHFFAILFLLIGFACALLSASFFERFDVSRGEYFFLLLSCLFGLLLIGEAADFLTLFLGMEILSISLYVLCGYMKRWSISNEASAKYFLIGALGASLFLYGVALIYGACGTTQLAALAQVYPTLEAFSQKALFMAGIAFVTVGSAFKAAIVPFHVWAPDVYEGAATPVTAFMAVGTKAGAFAAIVRVFLQVFVGLDPE